MNKVVMVGVVALVVFFGTGCAPAEEDDDGGNGAGGAGGAAPSGAGGAGAGGSAAGTGGAGAGGAGAGGAGAGGAGAGGAGGAGAGGSAAGTGGAGAGGAGAGGAGAGGAGAGGAGAGGAGAGGAGAGGAGGGDFELTSSAVENDGMLPAMYRCVALGGEPGPSVPLAWTAGPAGTMSYTLVFKDTSPAGTAGAGTFHWIIKNIPSATMMLPENVPLGAMPASVAGATQIANNVFLSNDVGYRGPCGGMNDYTFTLYAVNKASIDATTAAMVETEAMANNVGTSELVIHSMP